MSATAFPSYRDRGFPEAADQYGNDRIERAGWNVHRDFETPIAVIDRDALQHNAAVMHRWIASAGAELWPHAKTVMSPELVRLQLEHGSLGMTAATIAQVRLLRAWGVEHIILANQLVQRSAAEWVAADRRRHPEVGFLGFVDSAASVHILQDAAERHDTALDVLLEIGLPGKRTGIRTDEQRDDVLDALRSAPRVRLFGAAAYEGACGADRSPSALAAVDAYLSHVADRLREIADAGMLRTDRPVFSAGGSMFFDRVVRAAAAVSASTRVIVRSGCYVLHDHGLYARATPLPDGPTEVGLRAALTVWGTVHSRPEPTRAYVDVGRRDASYDQGLPVPLRRRMRGSARVEPLSARVVSLNDHHAHVEIDAESDIDVGDRIEFGISHPCTTMDRWGRVPVIDGDGDVVGAISTVF